MDISKVKEITLLYQALRNKGSYNASSACRWHHSLRDNEKEKIDIRRKLMKEFEIKNMED